MKDNQVSNVENIIDIVLHCISVHLAILPPVIKFSLRFSLISRTSSVFSACKQSGAAPASTAAIWFG